MMKTTPLFAAATSLLLAMPCIEAQAADRINVVASFSILKDLADNVGGDRVEVRSIVPLNGDAHVYQPRPADAAMLGEADLVLINGLEFEGFLNRLLETSETTVQVKSVSDGITPTENSETEHEHGHRHNHGDDAHHHGKHDPHAWQSIVNAKVYVDNIAEALCAIDETGCEDFKRNAVAYSGKLDALDQQIKTEFAKTPAAQRVVVTSHEAFNYFGRDYDIKFIGAEGANTASEASAADIARLIDQIKHDKVAALFVENITNPRMIEQLALETGITPGGTLYSDALTDEGGEAPTYLDLMQHNARTIAAAFAKR